MRQTSYWQVLKIIPQTIVFPSFQQSVGYPECCDECSDVFGRQSPWNLANAMNSIIFLRKKHVDASISLTKFGKKWFEFTARNLRERKMGILVDCKQPSKEIQFLSAMKIFHVCAMLKLTVLHSQRYGLWELCWLFSIVESSGTHSLEFGNAELSSITKWSRPMLSVKDWSKTPTLCSNCPSEVDSAYTGHVKVTRHIAAIVWLFSVCLAGRWSPGCWYQPMSWIHSWDLASKPPAKIRTDPQKTLMHMHANVWWAVFVNKEFKS